MIRKCYFFLLLIVSVPYKLFRTIDLGVMLKGCKIDYKVAIEGPGRIYNSSISKYTYIGKHARINKAKIGRFTSIGDYCCLSPSRHPIQLVSTSPVFYKKRNVFLKAFNKQSFTEYHDVVIGNDVWIGSHVTIMGGVVIGNGAIIGSYAVVTKDVPPYSIVVGNPGRVVKMRFEKDIIEELESISWWEMDEKELKTYGKFFTRPEVLIKEYKSRNV